MKRIGRGVGVIGIPRSEWMNQAQWAVTCPLLAAQLWGQPWGLPLAMAVCAVSLVGYGCRLKSLRPYRMQIRLGFLAVVTPALFPALRPILWLPVLGTAAQVLVGYCPMARLLDLMPWNRRQPLTLDRALGVVFRGPGSDGLVHWNAVS